MREKTLGEELIDAYRTRGDAYSDIAWIRSHVLDEEEKLAIGKQLMELAKKRRLRFSASGSFEAPAEPEHRDAPPSTVRPF